MTKGFNQSANLVITRKKIDEKTEGGIILPANHKKDV